VTVEDRRESLVAGADADMGRRTEAQLIDFGRRDLEFGRQSRIGGDDRNGHHRCRAGRQRDQEQAEAGWARLQQQYSALASVKHRIVQGQWDYLAVDRKGQLRPQPSFLHYPVKEARASRVEGAQQLADRAAFDLELRRSAAQVAQGRRDDNQRH